MLCQILGSVECSDSNGAGVYAMLMGCHELIQMGSQRAIIEGDLFSAIQWGQGKTQCLQRLADWVEEVHQISKQPHCTFQYVLREANDVAEGLKREGASS